MFLSKLFGIFKKKKDNPGPQASGAAPATPGATVPPAGVGAAVGLSQPAQSTDPAPTPVAEAPLPESTPSSFGQSDSLASTASPAADSATDISMGSDPSTSPAPEPPADTGGDQPAVDPSPVIPPVEETPATSPDTTPPAPSEEIPVTPDNPPAGGDDSTDNIAV